MLFVLLTDFASIFQCACQALNPIIASMLEGEKFCVEICWFSSVWFVNRPSNHQSPFISGLFKQCVLWSVYLSDWKIEICFSWQRVPICMHTAHPKGAVLSFYALTFFSPLSSPNLPPSFPCFFFFPTGQVVHLSHVWRPPEPTPLLSLLCLFWLFYKETHPRTRKKQKTQSR